MRRKKAKIKTSKIEARVSDKLAFATELAARRADLSLSAYVGKAVEEKLVRDGDDTLAMRVWSASISDRVVKLAINAPDLLTDDERNIMGVITRSPTLYYRDMEPDPDYQGDPDDYLPYKGGIVAMEWVGLFWEKIVKAARGEIPEPDFRVLVNEFHAAVPESLPVTAADFED